jgi:SAM-dependent methyltransferase
VPWNHNTHYTPLLLDLLPAKLDAVLDVGCGEGLLSAELAARSGEVVALDADLPQVELARERCKALPMVSVLHGDFLTAELPAGHFDAVIAVAALHHMPLDQGFARARELLRPGGRLLVLGVWTDRHLRDAAWNWRSVQLNRQLQARLGRDEMAAPATFDRTSWHDTRAWCRQHLPDARMTRLPLWRYTLIWEKPPST